MSNKRKVLLLGATGYSRETSDLHLKCVDWKKFSKIPNIRDYDVVVINLLELDAELRGEVDWQSFTEFLSFSHARDILQNGGKFIVIGDPRFNVEFVDDGAKCELPFLYWTGFKFKWDNDSGDTIEFIDDYDHRAYSEYVKQFKKWPYSLERCSIDEDVIEQNFNTRYLHSEGIEPDIHIDNICWNRYRNHLVFSTRLFFQKGRETILSLGSIIFLPKIEKNVDETLLIILRDLCSIESELPEPEWLAEYRAPGQDKVDSEIAEVRNDISKLFETLEKANARKGKLRECLKLLYEREFALEPVVGNILRLFGAHVEDPEEKNKEDGWVTIKIDDQTYEAVMEIKSTKSNQFGEGGRKQLLDWIDRGRTMREKEYKGIFIGNSAVDKPLKERPWAFSDSWAKAAELSGICAIKTEDLYFIYLLNSRNLIDLNQFWKDLFSTKGIFDMKNYLEAFSEKENG